MVMNDIAFNLMYMKHVFSVPATAELVRTKVINSLRLLGSLNADHVKSLFKAIRRPVGAAIGNSVYETAEHHLIVAFHIYKYWPHTSRERKNCAGLFTTGDVFGEAGRQLDLEKNWDNDQSIIRSFAGAEVNKNFNVIYEYFKDRCSSVRGCTNNPILYLMRRNLIPKDEADGPEAEYVTLD